MTLKGTTHQEDTAILRKYVPTFIEQILPDLNLQHGDSGRRQYSTVTNRQGIHLLKRRIPRTEEDIEGQRNTEVK